jgi:hypothetical protein
LHSWNWIGSLKNAKIFQELFTISGTFIVNKKEICRNDVIKKTSLQKIKMAEDTQCKNPKIGFHMNYKNRRFKITGA